MSTTGFAEHEQMIKNLLSLKAELISQMSNHNLGVGTQDMLEKLNLCLTSTHPPKK